MYTLDMVVYQEKTIKGQTWFSPYESDQLLKLGLKPDACYKVDLRTGMARIISVNDMPIDKRNREIQANRGIYYFAAFKKPNE